MTYLEQLELALSEFEKLSGEPLTIIDHGGILNFLQREYLFTTNRRSHKKIPFCNAAFSDKCIEHCRWQMNERSQKENRPFPVECPMGLRQIVVPLRGHQMHYGMLYLGAWRAAETPPAAESARPEWRALPESSPEKEMRLTALGEILAAGILEFLWRTGKLVDTPNFRGAKILNFLDSRLDHSIGLPDLAAELQLSHSYTSNLVKQLFGYSFSELLRKRRISKARHYLIGSDMRLHEIAIRCGFSSEYHLNKVFKQIMGVPPGRYRKIPEGDLSQDGKSAQ